MLKKYFIYLSFGFLMAFSCFASASKVSPVGLWETFDDATGKPHSLIRISEKNGELLAIVEKDLDPSDSADEVCEKCTGDNKNKKVIGMTIMDGMKQNGDDFEGGHILDPESGETYRCKLKLDASGNKLEVRGFIGVSLLGRSEIWTRVN
jgi:uncharacterized protein (DUF2147 family)